MAKYVHYQVPLVLYVGGVRHVVGRASINATQPGQIIAQISKPVREELLHILEGEHQPTEVSIEYSQMAKQSPVTPGIPEMPTEITQNPKRGW